MPRYFTEGISVTVTSFTAYNSFFFFTGTSAHQYQGDTPICLDNSKTPKAVPLLSLPIITSALLTLGKGLATTSTLYASHFPLIPAVFIFLSATSLAINGD